MKVARQGTLSLLRKLNKTSIQGSAEVIKISPLYRAVSAFLLMTASAHAGGQVAQSNHDWTGFYLGVQGGLVGLTDSFSDPGYNTRYGGPAGRTDGNIGLSGFTGGAHIGADWQKGNTVFGAVSDFSFGGAKGAANDVTNFVTGTASTNWSGSARARLGFATHDALLYVTGGLVACPIFCTRRYERLLHV